jgi:hypothetical protein
VLYTILSANNSMENVKKPPVKIALCRDETYWFTFEGKEAHILTTPTGEFGIIASLGTKFRTTVKNEIEFKDLDDIVLIQSSNPISKAENWAKAEIEGKNIKTEVNQA